MKNAMKKLLFLAVIVLTFGLVGCGSTLTTNLNISDNFAGSRTMDISIEKDTFDEYAPVGGFKTLAAETLENVPECMKFTYEEKDGKYIFHFVMSFTSKEEYEKQVSAVLGQEQEVVFTYSKSPFSNGISLQENFSSEDLMAWFKDYLVGTEYVDSEDSAYIFSTVKNSIHINGTRYDCKKNRLSVSKQSYIPIEEINIFTDIDAQNEKMARKIELIIDDYVMSMNREAIENYLKNITPMGCAGEWQTTEDYEKFILVVPFCSEEEMTNVMKIFCSSEKSTVELLLADEKETNDTNDGEDISYSDMWDEQILGDMGNQKTVDSERYVQPFGFETTISENLDMSSFICNSLGEIQTSYYISAKNGKPESMVYYPGGKESYGWDYIDTEFLDYYYVENALLPVYRVVSKVNKYYVPDNVEMNTTIKAVDKIEREFVFHFNEAFDKNAADKIENKMEHLFEEYKDLIDVSVKNKKDSAKIIWKFSGKIKEVNALCTEIFGMGYSEVSYYCQDKFVLNRQYDYKEMIDFRPVFDWEFKGDIDYTLKMTGKVNKECAQVTGGVNGVTDVSGKKVSYLSTESGYLDASVMGTCVNKVLVYIIAILVAPILKIIFAVLILSRKNVNTKKKV